MASCASCAPLLLGAEFADLMVFWTKMCFNVLGYSGDGIIAQVKAVRSHVGNVSCFVEALGQGHGLTHAVAQFSTGFLL
jgi:hypothetical protein